MLISTSFCDGTSEVLTVEIKIAILVLDYTVGIGRAHAQV